MLILISLLSILLIFPNEVNAYLDPGSGSLFLQMILGFILGALISVKVFWKQAVNFIKNLTRKKDKTSSNEQ
ncbi:MAG: hypothetical protein Q8P92_02135 [Candidatus Daviesbacteria bacterium]|nr:hypothetical protein [Candidatus Daviesbacteria bacterium]